MIVLLGVDEDDDMIPISIPPVPLLLEDLSSVEQPISENIRFLSSLDQEIKESFAAAKVEEKVANKKEERRAGRFDVKSICTMSAEEVAHLFFAE
jgi:hypothetical protein